MKILKEIISSEINRIAKIIINSYDLSKYYMITSTLQNFLVFLLHFYM